MPSELDAFPSITPSFHPNPGSFPHHYFSTFSPHNVFPQVTRFDTVIPSKMFAFWAESSHSFWRAWSLQLHLFHPSLEWVGGPQPPCCPLLLCAYSWPDISLPVTSATLFALLVLQFLILYNRDNGCDFPGKTFGQLQLKSFLTTAVCRGWFYHHLTGRFGVAGNYMALKHLLSCF